jgi:hypothetical protein
MIDLELLNGIADDVREALLEERSHTATLIQGLRDELASVKAAIPVIPEIIHGKDGAPGKDGEKGADGKDGRDGRDGIAKDGKDGRDAILTVTDEVSRLIDAQVEKRVGDTVQKAVDAAIGALPLMLYKGVWTEGSSYREGNTVTFGGSGWVCMKSDTTEKPGTGSDWILAIKKGRDGRDK